MSDAQSTHSSIANNSPYIRTLTVLGLLSTCLYGAVALFSWRFDYDSVTTERPIIAVLALFAATFFVYLLAIRLVWRAPQSRRLLRLIVWAGVVLRVVLLFSVPIQEIDIYRYLWDGAASNTGVSPFRYSPEQVRTADSNTLADQQLRKLVALRDGQPALVEILRRIHFAELPTIYPPTSQVVFAVAAATTPSDSSVLVRVFLVKAWLMAFDLATLGLVIALLKLCEKPVGLCIIYAWCPLLFKEVANSGHLDTIAVFLTTLAVYLAARLLVKRSQILRHAIRTTAHTTLIAGILAMAVGAKLYPIVLAPLVFLSVARQFGWRYVPVPAAVFLAATILVSWPMLPRETVAPAESTNAALDGALAQAVPPPEAASSTDPSQGVATFLRRWEMNDFIFLLLVENLKPASELPQDRVAWFAISPESTCQSIVESTALFFGVDAKQVPFLIARSLTGVAFVVVAFVLAWRAARIGNAQHLCEAGFLTLAWFWLLCPTQNPWYWTWALPLLPFARGRAWLAVSGIVLLYYLRFWLSYHWLETPLLGTGYAGADFFDFVVIWIEFAPWLLWLAIDAAVRNCRSRTVAVAAPQASLVEK